MRWMWRYIELPSSIIHMLWWSITITTNRVCVLTPGLTVIKLSSTSFMSRLWNSVWLKWGLSLATHYWLWDILHRVSCEWPYVPSNEHGNCKTVGTLLCYFPSYEQSDLPNKAINIFIISWYIHSSSQN